MSVSVLKVSDSDLYVQDLFRFGSKYDLRQQSIRILRAHANDIYDFYVGLRTSVPCWGLYISPGNELDFVLDDGKVHKVRDTDISVIPPWLPVIHHAHKKKGRHCYILCALMHVPNAVAQSIFDSMFRIQDDDLVKVFNDFAQLFNDNHVPPALITALHAQEIASRCFLNILNKLDDEQRQLFLEPNHAWSRLQPALNFISNRLEQSISIEELANTVNLSTDHFTRMFKKQLNQTPVQYIIAQRVTRAAELLFTTDEKLDDIAVRCGFPNRRYLSRRFSEHFGMSPKDFRANHD